MSTIVFRLGDFTFLSHLKHHLKRLPFQLMSTRLKSILKQKSSSQKRNEKSSMISQKPPAWCPKFPTRNSKISQIFTKYFPIRRGVFMSFLWALFLWPRCSDGDRSTSEFSGFLSASHVQEILHHQIRMTNFV